MSQTFMAFALILGIIIVLVSLFSFRRKASSSRIPKNEFDITEERERAIDYMENTSESVLITGRAGTGKSRLLDHFRKETKKKIVVLAPTGVAALNVQGQTIHSFFGFGIDITPNRVTSVEDQTTYKNLNAIIIDEISMVRADLLDCIDIFLRLNGPSSSLPFGGIQVIFIGDLYQLPPIVKKEDEEWFYRYYTGSYFFYSRVFERGFTVKHIELTKNYRQLDKDFTNVLDAIRLGTQNLNQLTVINQRYDPLYNDTKDDGAIHLKTTNEMARNLNTLKLSQIKKTLFSFEAEVQGDWTEGDVGSEKFPAEKTLFLKVGAQVMFLNNDSQNRWVNGDVGKVLGVGEDSNGVTLIRVILNGRIEYVGKHKWEKISFQYDEELKDIQAEPVGVFVQYPLRLAWAVTIHKAQGKTFDKVVIDLGRGAFAKGQTYVALSRCRTLKGITLKRILEDRDIMADTKISEFLDQLDSPD